MAQEQLRRLLDVTNDRATSIHAGRASAAAPDRGIEDQIKDQRHITLRLNNERLREEAAVRSGKFVLAADVVQAMGRVEERLICTFQSALMECANALISQGSPPGVLRILKEVWNEVRGREAKTRGAEAAQLKKFQEVEL